MWLQFGMVFENKFVLKTSTALVVNGTVTCIRHQVAVLLVQAASQMLSAHCINNKTQHIWKTDSVTESKTALNYD